MTKPVVAVGSCGGKPCGETVAAVVGVVVVVAPDEASFDHVTHSTLLSWSDRVKDGKSCEDGVDCQSSFYHPSYGSGG